MRYDVSDGWGTGGIKEDVGGREKREMVVWKQNIVKCSPTAP